MDGRFVPNISIGLPVVRALKKSTALPLDVHLMVVEPERYIDAFIDAGADILTIHVEACTHLQRALAQIRERGAKAGLALNPGSSIETLRYLIDDVDLILCMSVNPGFGGQSFIPAALGKVRALRELLNNDKSEALIEVDGGINADWAEPLHKAGCNILVAGTAVFGAADYRAAIQVLRYSPTG